MGKDEELQTGGGEQLSASSLTERSPLDTETIRRAMQGDKEAFSTLFMQTYRAMYLVVKGYLQWDEDIYDALQNGYTKAYKYLSRLQAPEAFYSWLKRIMENAAKDILADILGRGVTQESMEEYADELQIEYDGSVERRADIQQILERLDPRHTEVLTLHYYDGLKLSEIAKLLGEPPSTVRSRLTAAKKALTGHLKARGIDKSMYSGSLSAMIAVSLRSLIGTDVLSAATAQQMLDEILGGKYGRLNKAAYKVIEAQRNRAILKAVSLLMALTVLVASVTVLLITQAPWTWLDSLRPAAGLPHTSAGGGTEEPVFTGPLEGISSSARSTAPSAAQSSTAGESRDSAAPASAGHEAPPAGGASNGNVSGDTASGNTASTVSRTLSPAASTSAADSSSTSPQSPGFVPDYRPGTANTVGNYSNNLCANRGFVAKQDDWIYYSLGNGYRILMKMKTDGSQRQLVAEHDSGFSYLNVLGDWIYFCGSGLWRIRTDGSQKELISGLNANYLHVIGGTGYFAVEGVGTYTIYQVDIETGRTTVLKTSPTMVTIAVQDNLLLYSNLLGIHALDLTTHEERTLTGYDGGPYLVNGSSLYYTSGEKLYTLDYTNSSPTSRCLYSLLPLYTSLIFYSPYQNGLLGCWFGDEQTASISTVTLSGQKKDWSVSTRGEHYGFYTFDDEYVYFYTANLEFCRVRADGSGYEVFS